MTEQLRFTEQFRSIIGNLRLLREELEAAAIIVFPESPIDWSKLRKALEDEPVIVASTDPNLLLGAAEEKFLTIQLHSDSAASIHERISHAVLESVADDLIPHGSRVVVLYTAMDPASLDSVSVINLGEHLDRLSGRDLRQLESKVPLKTLKTVVDIAVDIGYEGREGSPIGSLFVVGDSKKVLSLSRPAGFDPVKGYGQKERTLFDAKVREAVKEIAQLDGAIIVSSDGIVESAARILESRVEMLSLSPGLGARHFAAAAISKATSAIAIAISQSSGTVRIFQNGEVMLRVESRQRQPLVWQDLKSEIRQPDNE